MQTQRGTIQAAILAGRVLLGDGAWGTQLQALGLGPGECPEAWNLSHPDAVQGIARAYAQAGADLVQTNSFGANRFKLAHYGLADQAAQINERAAALSRLGAGQDKWVLGSMGPSGKLLIMEEVTEDELYAAFKEQAMALASGGADALCIETMSDLEEAALAVRAAKESTSLEVIATFTFEKTLKGEYRSMMGVRPEEAAHAMRLAGADIIGANCGNGMANMLEIAGILRAAQPAFPLVIQSNAGLPTIQNGKTHFPATPQEMAEGAARFAKAGGGIIGGCCGTTPAHIAAMRQALSTATPTA